MPNFTPKQLSQIKREAGDQPASSLTSALQAQLATAAQGVKADAALPLAQSASAVASAAASDILAVAVRVSDLEAAAPGYQAALQIAHLEQRETAGTNGGVLDVAGAARTLTAVTNGITGATENSGGILLPAGTYLVSGWAVASGVGLHQAYLLQTATVHPGAVVSAAAGEASASHVTAVLTLAATELVQLCHIVQASVGADDGGLPLSGLALEVYASMTVWRLS